MNSPLTAVFLDRYVWGPNERAEEIALVAAMVGDAPTISPSDLTGWRAHALEIYLSKGLEGLVFYRLTARVAPLLESYAPTKESLTKALRFLAKRGDRARAAATALRALQELETALTALR